MLAALLLASGVTVVLADKAEVKGLDISVSEVATIQADDPAQAALVAAASLGYAPAPGYHRILRSDIIQFDLRRALPGLEIEVIGAERCRVDPLTERLDLERLWSLASAQVEELFRGTDASIKRDSEIPEVDVPVGEAPHELRASLLDRDVDAGPKTVAIQLWIDGDLYRTVHMPFNVSLREPRWVLKQNIEAGQVLEPSLFELRRVEVSFATAQHGLPMDAVTGTIAARPIAASSVVTERDIQRPIAVRRGEIVTVIIRSGAVEARDMGVAVHEARVGEMVRVTLNSTRREVSGRAKGTGEIEIILR